MLKLILFPPPTWRAVPPMPHGCWCLRVQPFGTHPPNDSRVRRKPDRVNASAFCPRRRGRHLACARATPEALALQQRALDDMHSAIALFLISRMMFLLSCVATVTARLMHAPVMGRTSKTRTCTTAGIVWIRGQIGPYLMIKQAGRRNLV